MVYAGGTGGAGSGEGWKESLSYCEKKIPVIDSVK
jgi:hypothetical protein